MSDATNCAARSRGNLSAFLEESAEQDDQDLSAALWFQMTLLARLENAQLMCYTRSTPSYKLLLEYNLLLTQKL
jgi:hypothetical protein